MKIKRIFVIFKTHLDIGFTDFSANIINNYKKKYIPASISTSAEMRKRYSDDTGFIWTTGSWLVWDALRTYDEQEKERLENAICCGDISWHGLPFTTHTELMDEGLFRYGLSLSQELDKRFGKHTIAAKMTDVPGHTKSFIAPLAEAGIKFLHIGVNPASTSPDVPRLFVWRDEDKEITVMYNADYGRFTEIGDSGDAVYFAHTGDNIGPQPPEEIAKLFDHIRSENPGVEVIASDLNTVAESVWKIKDSLPVITAEIGDTWIHGVGSDPKKVSIYRSALRKLATENIPDEMKKEAYRHLIMVPEHTWGLDEKTHLGEHGIFEKTEFDAARKSDLRFRKMELSWEEQRNYAYEGAAAAGISDVLKEYKRAPIMIVPGNKANSDIEINERGELSYLRVNGIQLADTEHTLCGFLYEAFSQDDYDRYLSQYLTARLDWALEDFQKIGIGAGNPNYAMFVPTLDCFAKREDGADIRIRMPREATEKLGCPEYADYSVTISKNTVYVDFAWFNKPATRVAEAMWLKFTPLCGGKIMLRKLGHNIDPQDVIKNGNRRLHAVESITSGNVTVEPLDSPLVSPGHKICNGAPLLDFNNNIPDNSFGFAFNLYNNIWGTNFPMWYDEDARFRYIITV